MRDSELPGSERRRPADAATREPQSMRSVLDGDAETVKAKCADCGALHEVLRFVWDLAVKHYKRAAERGEPTPSGVGRCDECAERWALEQKEISEGEHRNATALFQRMRKGLASIKAGKTERPQIRQFVDDLPGWFKAEHGASIKSFEGHADELFAKRDKETTGDGWDEFDGL